jgi:hypothetical protein
VLSIVFIVSYLSTALPAVGAGALVAWHGDIIGTAKQFGAAVMALAVTAILAAVLPMKRSLYPAKCTRVLFLTLVATFRPNTLGAGPIA